MSLNNARLLERGGRKAQSASWNEGIDLKLTFFTAFPLKDRRSSEAP